MFWWFVRVRLVSVAVRANVTPPRRDVTSWRGILRRWRPVTSRVTRHAVTVLGGVDD